MDTSLPLMLNYMFLLILVYILFYFLVRKNPLESFVPSLFGFDPYLHTSPSQLSFPPPQHIFGNGIYPPCTPENNCFIGTQARTSIYQNLCQPVYGPNRQPIYLQDTCQRTLGPFYNPGIPL